MAKESLYLADNPDILLHLTFTSEQHVRRNGGNPNAGTIPVVFSHGVATFDNSAVGVDNHISYPATKCRLSEPERAFSIRTKAYLTDTDGSVFAQLYDTATMKTFRFMISGVGLLLVIQICLYLSYGTGMVVHLIIKCVVVLIIKH
jgi:hypothetical protein